MTTATQPRKFARLRQRKPPDRFARTLRETREWSAFLVLAAAAASSVLITVAIVVVLLYESSSFFQAKEISLWQFLTGTEWAPLFFPPKWKLKDEAVSTETTAAARPLGLT